MLNKNDQSEAVARTCEALGNVCRDLMEAGGVPAEMLAAGIRTEAGKIEARTAGAGMAPDEAELVQLARKAHEFINSLQIAGIEERTAVTCIANACVERVARLQGAAGAAHWLRNLAKLVDAHGDAIEETARAH
jgi:hypothetical protein